MSTKSNSLLSKLHSFYKKLVGRDFDKSSKCPKCGSHIEAILLPNDSTEPAVYRCNSCRCTITKQTPSTVLEEEENENIQRFSEFEEIIPFESGRIEFTGTVYGSVGLEYNIIFSKEAFKVNKTYKYLYPKDMEAGLDGADEALVKYILEPQKKGLFRITEEASEGSITHYYLVE